MFKRDLKHSSLAMKSYLAAGCSTIAQLRAYDRKSTTADGIAVWWAPLSTPSAASRYKRDDTLPCYEWEIKYWGWRIILAPQSPHSKSWGECPPTPPVRCPLLLTYLPLSISKFEERILNIVMRILNCLAGQIQIYNKKVCITWYHCHSHTISNYLYITWYDDCVSC